MLSRPQVLSWVLTPVLVLAPCGVQAAPASDDAEVQARAAYKEGEKAYRLGDFETAARHFEEAYELSGLPDILYNIGLSHLRWYDVDPDIAHLRKSKVVFQNYIIEIQKDPELGSLEEAEGLIEQIDEKIAAHEKAEAEARAAQEGEGPKQPIDLGPDPGKKLRLAGAISMGVGGAFVLAGGVAGVVLGVRGQEFQEKLAASYAEREMLGCAANSDLSECDLVNAEIDAYRNNGQRANVLAVGLGLGLGGLGIIGLVGGAVVFIQGEKKTKAWEARQVSVAPAWIPGGGGLSISGRF